MEFVYALDEIDEAAVRIWENVADHRVIAFEGDMGAGKTTLIHAICRLLGVRDGMSSPSFSIINEYKAPRGRVFHIDLYRCRDEEEAIRAGVADCLDSGDICFVEWPARAPGIFSENTVRAGINEAGATHRRVTIPYTAV